jgi:hypothetical protein
VLITYCISIGLKAELNRTASSHWELLNTLEILNLVLRSIFVYDTLLFWIDDFDSYWNSGWFITDFICTMIIFIPDIIFAEMPYWMNSLHVFAVIKIIVRVESLCTIVVTILNSLWSMVYIIMFIFMFGTVYAHLGINLFADYSKAQVQGLMFQDFFR